MNMLTNFLTPLSKRASDIHPYKDLRRQIDSLFDDFQSRAHWPANWPGVFSDEPTSLVPNLEIKEDDQSITISSEIPGVDEKDIEVSVRDDVLTIQGEKKHESETKEGDRFVTERSYGKFSRSTTLPFPVDDDAVQASYAKGVLTVTIKKPATVETTVKRIAVKGE